MKIDMAIELASKELRRATTLFGSFHSAHEGYAVIKEEMDELWDAVKLNHKRNPDRDEKIKGEAIQVAAMGLRFLMDCCEEERSDQVGI